MQEIESGSRSTARDGNTITSRWRGSSTPSRRTVVLNVVGCVLGELAGSVALSTVEDTATDSTVTVGRVEEDTTKGGRSHGEVSTGSGRGSPLTICKKTAILTILEVNRTSGLTLSELVLRGITLGIEPDVIGASVLTRVGHWNKQTVRDGTSQAEVVPDFLKSTTISAADIRLVSKRTVGKGVKNLGLGVLFGSTGTNAGAGQEIISRQCLLKTDDSVVEVSNVLVLVGSGRVASGVDGGHASSVLVKLVEPELRIRTSIVLPTVVHFFQKAVRAGLNKGLSSVGDFPAGVAVLGVAASTLVAPKTVGGEQVVRTSYRVEVPELSSKENTLGGFVTAAVGYFGTKRTGQWGVIIIDVTLLMILGVQ